MPTIIADQSRELESVKARIRKLAAKTVDNGCTEHEVLAAMDKICDLLEVFDIELDDALLDVEHCIKQTFWTGSHKSLRIAHAVRDIANFTDCVYYRTRGYHKQGFGYAFFGLESDTQMAVYLCEIIDKAIITELANYKLTDPVYVKRDTWAPRKTLSTNFVKGMADRIGDRLGDMKSVRIRKQEEIDKRESAALRTHLNQDCKAIIPIHRKKKLKVDAEFAKTGTKLVFYGGSDSASHSGARAAGRSAGDGVNLNRPLGGRSQRLLG